MIARPTPAPLRFGDGESFDTRGPLRIVSRADGLYVCGRGMLLPVADRTEGRAVIEEENRRGTR